MIYLNYKDNKSPDGQEEKTMTQLTQVEFLVASLEEISKDFGPFVGVDEAGNFDSYSGEEAARQNSVIFFEVAELDQDDLEGDLAIEVFPCYVEKMDQNNF